ncbi:MAG: DNA recombination protein RmuC [Gaiellaceae bacterium]
MQTFAFIAVLVVALAAAAGWIARLLRRELGGLRSDTGTQLGERNAEVDRRLQTIAESVDRRLAELDVKVDRRLETASKASDAIHERLGKLGEATFQMNERVRDLARLEQALRPPKARGGFGELLLENLLRDRLPRDAYEMQHGFSGGERVDAVIRVDKLVPVDSKFPLENFHRLVEAEDDLKRSEAEKLFGRDVKVHIDAVAKYIRPGEGTYDFALMYVPAEAVYYELVGGRTGALYSYAVEKRVFPVSPTTFDAYLQVIALGLKGLQIEQHAQEVMASIAQLGKDFGRFREDFEVVGKHLGNAQGRYAEAERRLDRFEGELERAVDHRALEPAVDGTAIEEPPPVARALDAA